MGLASDVSLAHATAAGIRGTAADHRLTVALRRSERGPEHTVR